MTFRDLIEAIGEVRPPAMVYDGDDTPERFGAWQEAFRAKLVALRGEPLDRPAPPTVDVLSESDEGDHIRQRIDIGSVLGTKVPAYLLIPKGDGPNPGMLALHGHLKRAKECIAGVKPPPPNVGPRDYGAAAARAGFVTLCPDWWGWGDRVEPGFENDGRDMCNVKFMAAAMYGVPALSIMISDGLAALDVLAAREDVDGTRIGAMGNSYGGRMSMWLAAFDERISAVVASGCMNCFRERSLKLSSCGVQFLPGILAFGDVQEVFATLAPRPLMLACGEQDTLLPAEYIEKMIPVVERAYRICGAPENLNIYRHGGGHFLPVQPAVAWLRQVIG